MIASQVSYLTLVQACVVFVFFLEAELKNKSKTWLLYSPDSTVEGEIVNGLISVSLDDFFNLSSCFLSLCIYSKTKKTKLQCSQLCETVTCWCLAGLMLFVHSLSLHLQLDVVIWHLTLLFRATYKWGKKQASNLSYGEDIFSKVPDKGESCFFVFLHCQLQKSFVFNSFFNSARVRLLSKEC